MDLYAVYYLPMHTRVAGFGVQVPSGDTPFDLHTAVILPVGTNPVSHLKCISVLLTVLGTFAMEPFPGAVGIPQLTKEKSNQETIYYPGGVLQLSS